MTQVNDSGKRKRGEGLPFWQKIEMMMIFDDRHRYPLTCQTRRVIKSKDLGFYHHLKSSKICYRADRCEINERG